MIIADNLSKQFGSLTAVDGLSFTARPGEIIGLLGPNGAGKSTTMRMLTGFLRPDSGDAQIGGHSINEAPVKAKQTFGYLPEGAPAYGEMTPLGFLQFVADIRKPDAGTKTAVDKALSVLDLHSVARQPIDTLSKGYKRRVGLAQAILHEPAVLILDEPTDGLDPNQKHQVRSLIRELSEDRTIVVSTHLLEEVSTVCTRALIIDHGKLKADATPAELAARSRYHNAVSVRFREPEQLARYATELQNLEGVATVESDGPVLTAIPSGNTHLLGAVNDLAEQSNWPVSEIRLEAGRLDDVFRTITTGDVQ